MAVSIRTRRPCPSHELGSEMADDLTAVTISVVLRIFQMTAQITGRQIIPPPGERSLPPLLCSTGSTARGIVGFTVTSGAGQAGCTVIHAAACDVEEMRMPVVALTRKIRQRVAILATGAGKNAGDLCKSGHRFWDPVPGLRP